MTEAVNVTTTMFGESVEIPAGMTEAEYWAMIDTQIKDAQYERLMEPGRIIRAYVLAQDQNAHPVENETALALDREHMPRPRRLP